MSTYNCQCFFFQSNLTQNITFLQFFYYNVRFIYNSVAASYFGPPCMGQRCFEQHICLGD